MVWRATKATSLGSEVAKATSSDGVAHLLPSKGGTAEGRADHGDGWGIQRNAGGDPDGGGEHRRVQAAYPVAGGASQRLIKRLQVGGGECR